MVFLLSTMIFHFPHLSNGCHVNTLEWACTINILIKQMPKIKTFINQISQGTLLKGVFLYRRLPAIISTSLEECDQGNLGLSVVSKHWSLLIICHKGFQSHLITSIFLALAISNSLTHLITKLNL